MRRLKITFITSLLALLFCTRLNAQKLYLGIKAGVNYNTTQGTNLNNNFSGYFLGGGYVGLHFGIIKVQADVLYSETSITTGDNFYQAFGNYVSSSASSIKNGTFKMNELSVPVVVAVNILPKFLWLEAGPQYSGVVSTKDVDDFVNNTKAVIKSGYMSGVVGVELQLPLNLNVGMRYIFGISNRNNTDISDSWKTQQYQAHIGFKIF